MPMFTPLDRAGPGTIDPLIRNGAMLIPPCVIPETMGLIPILLLLLVGPCNEPTPIFTLTPLDVEIPFTPAVLLIGDMPSDRVLVMVCGVDVLIGSVRVACADGTTEG